MNEDIDAKLLNSSREKRKLDPEFNLIYEDLKMND